MKYESQDGGFYFYLGWSGLIVEFHFLFRGKHRALSILFFGCSWEREDWEDEL